MSNKTRKHLNQHEGRSQRSLWAKILPVALAVGLMSGGGVAFAYWSASPSWSPAAINTGTLDTYIVSSLVNERGGAFTFVDTNDTSAKIDQNLFFENIYPGESIAVTYTITNTGTSPYYLYGQVAAQSDVFKNGSGSYLTAAIYVGQVTPASPEPLPTPGQEITPGTSDLTATNIYVKGGTATVYTPGPVTDPLWVGSRTGSCTGTQVTTAPLTTIPASMNLPAPSAVNMTTGQPSSSTGVLYPGQALSVCVLVALPTSANPPSTLQGAAAPTLLFNFQPVQVAH